MNPRISPLHLALLGAIGLVFAWSGWHPYDRMGIRALYELLEWVTALTAGSASAAFLGTQGDVSDRQEDMFMALISAISALVFMSSWQNKQMRKLPSQL